MARLLPLCSPPVNTKFIAISNPNVFWSANVYVPCARPISFEVPDPALSGPVVSGSSMATTAPKKVEEELDDGACAIRIAVGLGPPTTSWK
uniref:Uncharacterized protein n=1 Tax=Arundo donax TaxID=35708 RepID=A0A0A9CMH2_ARUDO